MIANSTAPLPNICESCPVRPHSIYAPMSSEEATALNSLRRRSLTLEARRMIHREGETPVEVFTLLEGWAFRFKLMADGRRQILSFLLPGDFLSLHALQSRPLHFSVQALTTVRLCVFETRTLSEFLRGRPHLAWNVGTILARKSARLDYRITDLGRRDALERIARFLLEIGDRLKRRGLATDETFAFPLRQEHIADALGLTTVHVSRTIAMLRGEGLVTLGHGLLTIHDRNRLTEIAGRGAHSATDDTDGVSPDHG